MSSPEGYEGAFWGAGLDPEGGRQARKLGPTFGASPSSPGRRGLPEPASLEEEEEREVMGAAGGPVLWGREGRPGSPAGVEGRFLDYLGSEAATAILQQLTDRDDLRVRRNPSPESCDSKVLPVWADPQPGPSGTGAPGPGVGGWRRLPSSAPARRRRARGKPRRGAKDRWQVPEERQARPAEGPVGPPSDSESSDEFSEEQLLGLSTRRRGGGQAKRHGPRDPPRHSCSHSGEKFLPVQGPFPLSAPRPLALVGDRQAAGGLDASWRKPQSAVCGKAGSRPSYLPGAAAAAAPAAAAAAAAASGQPRATPGRKAAQGKKSPGGACKAAPRNTYPSWEHTASEAAALDPATFPPISGSPLGRGKRYPMAPLGTKQSRRTGTGQKGVSRRKRETMPAVVEDKEPRRDPGAEAQLLTLSPWPSCSCECHRECNTGHADNNRATQVPGHSQPVALSQGEGWSRGPTPYSDQGALGHPPTAERQQQPPEAAGCPRCPVLQRQIHHLREQLASMRSLVEKFQSLCC